jgi:ribosome-associated translation inhibitor RaiA
MYIQLNTNEGVRGDDRMSARVEAEIEASLGQFEDQLSAIEVYLSDANGGKSGADDKKCTIEARPNGYRAVAATHEASTLEEAITGAVDKMQRRLDHELGKRREHRDDGGLYKGGETLFRP